MSNDKKSSIRREDRPGHLDPDYAKSLRALGGKPHDNDKAFVNAGRTGDALAEELAEEAVVAMTSGEDSLDEDREKERTEERGGPFVVSPAAKEFAPGTDASNPRGSKRAPFPTV